MKTSGSRYLLCVALIATLALLSVWYYAEREAIAFMESGYGVWKAKETLVARCELGSDIFLGDSQTDSAIIPRGLSASSTNLALAGGTPVESYFLLERILTCPTVPRRVVLAFGVSAFQEIEPFLWESAVRYRVFGVGVLQEISQMAARLHDPSYARVETRDGNTGVLRDLIYGLHLPSIYFSALVEGRLFMRRAQNQARLAEVLEARGYPNYGQGANANGVPAQPMRNNFDPLPLQVNYFDAMVAQLEQRNIRVDFVITPIEKSRSQRGAAIDQYQAFLSSSQRRHPNLHLLQSEIPWWDSSLFVDGVHLNNSGARKFTALLERCLTSSPAPHADCSFAPD